jgi:G:T/U-mismatch repair DNA glycosylase
LPSKADKLIIGSFPCFNGKDYGDWFYSGSGKNHFWKLLSDTLGMPAETKKQKIALCEKHNIALTDIALEVMRTKNNCSDSNLKIVEFNKNGIDHCLKNGIIAVFFTSRFVEKHFNRLYPGLKIETHVLLSPSPAANMHIGGLTEYKQMRAGKVIGSPYEYRLLNYKKLLLKDVLKKKEK